MYWPKCWAREVHFGRDRGSFVPYTYLGLALDRGVQWGALYGCCYALCVCPCVCKGIFIIWCLYETPIYFSCIYWYVVMFHGKFPRGLYTSLVKLELDIHGRKGVQQNGFFIYFGGSKCLACISRIVCCSLAVLVIRYVISFIFYKFNGTF